jgi:DNA repair exonuclease SbcCD ATPase subunit
MRLVRFEAENFCQFKRRIVEFHPNMNLIVGPNGSGKSNLVKGVYATMTNDYSRNEGVKAVNICQLAGPTERSKTRLLFEHANVHYEVERSLRPDAKVLRVAGESPIRSDAGITNRILGALGITEKILGRFVFVDQGEVADFLSMRGEDRAKTFQRLFGIEHAEKCWEAAGKAANKVVVPSFDAEKERLTRETQTVENEMVEIENLLGYAVRESESFKESWQDLTDFIARARRAEDLESQKKSGEELTAQLREEVANLFRERELLSSDIRLLKGEEERAKKLADEAKISLSQLSKLRSAAAYRTRLVGAVREIQEEGARKSEPARPADYEAESPNELRDKLHNEVTLLSNFVQSFDSKNGTTECPTCGTPVRSFVDRLVYAEKELPEKIQQLKEMDRRFYLSVEFDEQLERYRTWKEGWSKRLEQAQRQLVDLGPEEKVPDDEEELRTYVKVYEDLAETLRINEGLYNEVDKKWALKNSDLDAGNSMVWALINEIAGHKETFAPDKVAAAQRSLERMEQLNKDITGYRARKEALDRLRASLLKSLRSVIEEEDKAGAARSVIKRFNDIRDVLHRDNLPRLVSKYYLERMQTGINSYLGLFDSPFRITVEEDQSFRATFNDGRSQVGGRLSEGEKVVLAWAFRFTTNATFAKDIGLLCMDEPTAGLDSHNLGCLERALLRMRELSTSSGIQVIIVTHERSLDRLFDKVIDLS